LQQLGQPGWDALGIVRSVGLEPGPTDSDKT
jgi:hypothetical protein